MFLKTNDLLLFQGAPVGAPVQAEDGTWMGQVQTLKELIFLPTNHVFGSLIFYLKMTPSCPPPGFSKHGACGLPTWIGVSCPH